MNASIILKTKCPPLGTIQRKANRENACCKRNPNADAGLYGRDDTGRFLPALLLPMENSGQFVGWLYLFGVMMLGVSSFGREIGLKTVPFMLAQPLDPVAGLVDKENCGARNFGSAWFAGGWCVSLALSPQELYRELTG